MSRWSRYLMVALGMLTWFLVTTGTATATPCQKNCSQGPPTPAGVSAQALQDGTVELNWTAPVWHVGRSTQNYAYLYVYRDGSKIATLHTHRGGNYYDKISPSTYVDKNPPPGELITYQVTSGTTSGKESPSSNSAPARAITTTGAKSPANGINLGGGSALDIKMPNFQGTNKPTACEAYCGTSNGDISNTYGKFTDASTSYEMFLLQAWWKILIFFSYLSFVLLAWTVTKQLYQGIVLTVTALIQAIFQLQAYSGPQGLVVTAAAVGGLILATYGILSRFQLAKKSVGFMVLGLAAISAFTLFAPPIVSDVMTSPTIVAQGVLGEANQLMNDLIDKKANVPDRYNISVKPTYHGNAFVQGVRRFEDSEYLNTVYAGNCTESFGNLEWATTNYVPDASPAIPGFHGLTYCEYWVKAKKLGNSAALSNLRTNVKAATAGTSNSNVWTFYQGQDVLDHYGYMFPIGWGLFFRSALLMMTAFVFATSIYSLGFMLVKSTILLVGWLIPPLQGSMTRLARQMVLKITLPIYLILSVVIGMVFSTISFDTVDLLGWMGMMFFQVVSGLASFIVAVMLWRRHKAKETTVKAMKQTDFSFKEDGEESGPATSTSAPRQTSPRPGLLGRGAQVAMAMSTGGTSAVATMAAKGAGKHVLNRVSGGKSSSSSQTPRTDGAANRRNLLAGSSKSAEPASYSDPSENPTGPLPDLSGRSNRQVATRSTSSENPTGPIPDLSGRSRKPTPISSASSPRNHTDRLPADEDNLLRQYQGVSRLPWQA